jgi:hypothetical protein
MSKKVAFGTKPTPPAPPASLDDLVKSRSEVAQQQPAANEVTNEGTRRLSLDLPISLHTKVKMHCVQNGLLMADYVRGLITQDLAKK